MKGRAVRSVSYVALAFVFWGVRVLVALAPINLLMRKRPEDIGLQPDGDPAPVASSAKAISNIIDPVWAGTDWTLRRALRTARRTRDFQCCAHDPKPFHRILRKSARACR